jgi:hypothetical protein
MKFEYGIENNKVNITKIVLNKCVKNNILYIPKNDVIRKNLFKIDPCPNVVKNVYINGIIYNHKEEIKINLDNKICVCFYGLTRSLKYTINSIRENILKVLISNNYYFDIYLHTYDLKYINNNRSNEINIKLDTEEYKLLNCDYIKIDNQNEFDKSININNFLVKGDPWPENPKISLLNLLRQLNSLKHVNLLSNLKKINYTHYLYLRPDLKYLNKFDCNIIKNSKSNEFYTPNWGKFGGLNDRMAFGMKTSIDKFANRIEESLLYSKTNKLHSERFLKYVMHNFKIEDIKMNANRVRSNGNMSKDC